MPALTTEIHTRVARLLGGTPELRSIPVLVRQPKETLSDIYAAVAQLKLGCFVFPPLITQVRPNSKSLFAEEIEVRVSCFENPLLNDTTLSVQDLVRIALATLHHADLQLEAAGVLYARERPVEEQQDDTLIVYDIVFLTCGAPTG